MQLLDCDMEVYMLSKPENEKGINQLNELKIKEEQQWIENDKNRKRIISTLNIVSLKEYKKSLQ